MKRISHFLLALCGLILTALTATASPAETTATDDSLTVSLLTCAPGRDSYSLYGHTALRVKSAATGDDFVFNYGVFSFRQPHFVWRFMLGKTDYTAIGQHFDDFAREYAADGRSVTEQRLNLTQPEARRLTDAVMRNVMTDGWTYRYNFLKDNCTSRVVAMIEEALDGTLQLPTTQPTTYRDIIHSYAADAAPWSNFGQDLILGAAVDTTVSTRGAMAFPLLAEAILDKAVVTDAQGTTRQLVGGKEEVVSATAPEATAFWISPMAAALFLLLLAIGVSLPNLKGHASTAGRLFDYATMLVEGLAGCLVFLLFFFSEQPAVDSNWLFTLLNPLPLICLPIKAWREAKGRKDHYIPLVQLLLVVLCLLTGFLQKYPAEIYVLASALLIRSLATRHAMRTHTKTTPAAQHAAAHT